MARPIGIFSVLMALGGYLAVRYVQNKQAGRFDGAAQTNGGSPGSVSGGASTGNPPLVSTPDDRPWPFPRSR